MYARFMHGLCKNLVTSATAKIKRTIWGVVVKATLSPTAALFVVLRRSIEQVLYMLARLLRTSAAIAIAKLDVVKVKETEGTIGGSYCYR